LTDKHPPEQVFSLYNGEIELRFNPSSHRYYVKDGDEEFSVPSVTTVVDIIDKSGALVTWATRAAVKVCKDSIEPNTPYPEVYLEQVFQTAATAHRQLKDIAAGIGTTAHNAIELAAHAEGRFSENLEQAFLNAESEEVANCLWASYDWVKSHSVEVVVAERKIYSRKYQYSGTLDMLAFVDGKFSLLDWKSSKGIYPSHLYQTAAYQAAYEEEIGRKLEARYLVRLGKEDGAFEAHQFSRGSAADHFRNGFLPALKLYHTEKKVQKQLRGEGNVKRGNPSTTDF